MYYSVNYGMLIKRSFVKGKNLLLSTILDKLPIFTI